MEQQAGDFAFRVLPARRFQNGRQVSTGQGASLAPDIAEVEPVAFYSVIVFFDQSSEAGMPSSNRIRQRPSRDDILAGGFRAS